MPEWAPSALLQGGRCRSDRVLDVVCRCAHVKLRETSHAHTNSGDTEGLKAHTAALNHSVVTRVYLTKNTHQQGANMSKHVILIIITSYSILMSLIHLPSLSLITISEPDVGWFDGHYLSRKPCQRTLDSRFDILSTFQQGWNLSKHVGRQWAALTVWNQLQNPI